MADNAIHNTWINNFSLTRTLATIMIQYRKTIIAMVIISVTIAIFFIYKYFDPAGYGFFPKCPSKLITGYDCPGCGSQRALHALLNGDLDAAFHYNAFLFIAVPFLIIYAFVNFNSTKFPRLYKFLNSATIAWTSLVIIVIWWILRNTISI